MHDVTVLVIVHEAEAFWDTLRDPGNAARQEPRRNLKCQNSEIVCFLLTAVIRSAVHSGIRYQRTASIAIATVKVSRYRAKLRAFVGPN